MSETIEGLRNMFIKCNESFESKGLKDSLMKNNVMVCGSITNDGMSKSNVDPCGVCSLRANLNSVLYLQRAKLIHGRCAGVKMVTRCGRVKFRECDELLYGRRFPLMLKEVVYKSYVRPTILYESVAWCLKESEMGILPRTEISMVRAMC